MYPQGYPTRLMRISWTKGAVAGPYNFYSRKLPYKYKSCGLFVYNFFQDYFAKNLNYHEEWCSFLAEHVTVFFKDNGFHIKLKPSFDFAKWLLFFETKETAAAVLHDALKSVKLQYQALLPE